MARNSSGTARLATLLALLGAGSARELDDEEHQDRKADEQGRADCDHRRELDPNDLPQLDRQRPREPTREEDRDDDLVEGGDEREGGAACKAGQDERQGNGSKDPPMRG